MIDEKTEEFLQFIKDEYRSIFFWHKPKNVFRIKSIEVIKRKDKLFDIKFKDKPLFFDISNSKIVRLIIENLLMIEKLEEEYNDIKNRIEKFRYNMSNEELKKKKETLDLLSRKLDETKKNIEKLLDIDQEHQSNVYELMLLKKSREKLHEDNPRFWILENKIYMLEEKIEKRDRNLDWEIEKFNTYGLSGKL